MVKMCEKRRICEMKVKDLDQDENLEKEGVEDEDRMQCLDSDHGCGRE